MNNSNIENSLFYHLNNNENIMYKDLCDVNIISTDLSSLKLNSRISEYKMIVLLMNNNSPLII